MSRLYDRLQNLQRWSINIPVIKISNVARYYWNNHNSLSSLASLPNVASPFPCVFIESDNYDPRDKGLTAFGCLLNSDTPRDMFDIYYKQTGINMFASIDAVGFLTAKWVCSIDLFLEYGKGNIAPFGIKSLFAVNEDGTIYCAPGTDTPRWLCNVNPPLDKKILTEDMLRFLIRQYYMPVLLSLSFMHCKNVSIVPNTVPDKVNKKRVRKQRAPRTLYYTLDIDPMKTVLRKEGNIETEGLKRALHICRGHFKDFRGGKGLFGKHKEIYWWDAAVRGSVTEGIIHKDYNVKSPK